MNGIQSLRFVKDMLLWTISKKVGVSFPDSKAYKYELLLKYHTTLLKRLYVVSCDGGRYLTVLPNYWLYEDKEKQVSGK